MKKLLFIILAMAGFNLCACSQKQSSPEQSDNNKTDKVLVAYFSATGVTEGVAKRIAEIKGGTLLEIKPETEYTNADLDWTDEQSRSSLEMKDRNSRPAITGQIDNMADYTTIYLGFPIWWYTAPTIINSFMESYDMKGKTIIPFATSGGSTIEKACEELKTAYPDVNWKEGKLLNNVSDSDLKLWLE